MGLLTGTREGLLRIGRLVDRLSPVRLFVLTFIVLFAVYFPTSTRHLPYHIDPFSNVLPAWSLGTRGTLYLDGYDQLARPAYYGKAAWLVHAQGRTVSQYPPGTALFATPFYWLSNAEPQDIAIDFRVKGRSDKQVVAVAVPPLWPASAAASVAVAAAMACLAVAFVVFVSPRQSPGRRPGRRVRDQCLVGSCRCAVAARPRRPLPQPGARLPIPGEVCIRGTRLWPRHPDPPSYRHHRRRSRPTDCRGSALLEGITRRRRILVRPGGDPFLQLSRLW